MVKRLTITGFLCSALWFVGCTNQGRDIVQAQTPGEASGAGATLKGPANSAAPTSQKSVRVARYAPKFPGWMTEKVPAINAKPSSAAPRTVPSEPQPELAAADGTPQPVWTYESTETSIGQHQDAAGIVKVALAAAKWSGMRWIGILCVAFCIGGLLWSHGNPDGFPVVFWKVGACGVVMIIFADNPAWLLLLLIPLGFYAAQKMNLLRIP